MFNQQRELYHRNKATMPKSPPAGFRFMGYINPRRCFNIPVGFDTRSPDPSPLNSPRPLAERSSSILHIPGRFPKPDRPQAARPFMLTPDEQRANNANINASAQVPLLKSAPRRMKHGSQVPFVHQRPQCLWYYTPLPSRPEDEGET